MTTPTKEYRPLHETPSPEQCLLPGPAVDADHPTIVTLAHELVDPGDNDLQNAVTL